MILLAVRWYFRFTLSIRDVELMAERGIEASRETVRCYSLIRYVIFNTGLTP